MLKKQHKALFARGNTICSILQRSARLIKKNSVICHAFNICQMFSSRMRRIRHNESLLFYLSLILNRNRNGNIDHSGTKEVNTVASSFTHLSWKSPFQEDSEAIRSEFVISKWLLKTAVVVLIEMTVLHHFKPTCDVVENAGLLIIYL